MTIDPMMYGYADRKARKIIDGEVIDGVCRDVDPTTSADSGVKIIWNTGTTFCPKPLTPADKMEWEAKAR